MKKEIVIFLTENNFFPNFPYIALYHGTMIPRYSKLKKNSGSVQILYCFEALWHALCRPSHDRRFRPHAGAAAGEQHDAERLGAVDQPHLMVCWFGGFGRMQPQLGNARGSTHMGDSVVIMCEYC